MATPNNRKLIQISSDAYLHLLKLRDAQARALNFPNISITNCASNLILTTPVSNGDRKSVV